MPNEQTSVPLFAAAEVLTAANMNLSAGTGVPVFATTATRNAAFGGANEKVLSEGQLCYLSSTNQLLYYDGTNWLGQGLSHLSTTTVSASGALSLPASTFVGTFYRNYRVVFKINTVAAGTTTMRLRSGGVDDASANYDYAGVGLTYAGAAFNLSGAAQTSFALGNSVVGNTQSFAFDILSPQIAGLQPAIIGALTSNTAGNVPGSLTMNGQHRLTTTFDSLTFLSTGSQTMTAMVYAYQGVN